MNTKVFSDDEQVRRVWDMEEVKDLMARRAYLYMQDLRREEIETLWVQKPENKRLRSSALTGASIRGLTIFRAGMWGSMETCVRPSWMPFLPMTRR